MTNLIQTNIDTATSAPVFAFDQWALFAPSAFTETVLQPTAKIEIAKPKRLSLLENRGRRAKRRAGRH